MIVAAALAAVLLVVLSPGSERAGSDESVSPAPARQEVPARKPASRPPAASKPAPPKPTPPRGGPEAPEMGCPYPADVPRTAPGCPPRHDAPQTPGAAPGQPWLIRG
jgi:hypothetical protein